MPYWLAEDALAALYALLTSSGTIPTNAGTKSKSSTQYSLSMLLIHSVVEVRPLRPTLKIQLSYDTGRYLAEYDTQHCWLHELAGGHKVQEGHDERRPTCSFLEYGAYPDTFRDALLSPKLRALTCQSRNPRCPAVEQNAEAEAKLVLPKFWKGQVAPPSLK
jgi:hypothetical protein